MRKSCLHCEKQFYGRSDKQFCSIACKNAFHNREYKHTIEHQIDAALHHNHSILLKLMPAGSGGQSWSRELLAQHGFRFDLCTGVRPGADDTMIYVVYDFEWTEGEGERVTVDRVDSKEPAEVIA